MSSATHSVRILIPNATSGFLMAVSVPPTWRSMLLQTTAEHYRRLRRVKLETNTAPETVVVSRVAGDARVAMLSAYTRNAYLIGL